MAEKVVATRRRKKAVPEETAPISVEDKEEKSVTPEEEMDKNREDIVVDEKTVTEAMSDLEPKEDDANDEVSAVLSESEVEANKDAESEMYDEGTPRMKRENKALKKEKTAVLSQVAKSTKSLEETLEETSRTAKDDLLKLKGVHTASRSEKSVIYSDGDIIPLGETLQFESEGALRRKSFLELVNSKRGKSILSGHVAAITEFDGHICAVVRHGVFTVIIPSEMFTVPGEERQLAEEEKASEREHMLWRFMNSRIGSEVDYIVESINENDQLAVGNRKAAMATRKQVWYLTTEKRTGKYVLNEGTKVEARVVVASKAQITVEVFGIEYKLREKDLSSVHIPDMSKEFPVGSTVPVIFTKLERIREGKNVSIKSTVSVKEATPDSRQRYFDLYSPGSIVMGTVTGIEEYGIYVRIEGMSGKLDMLCAFPKVGANRDASLPTIGERKRCKITSKNEFDEHGNAVYRIYGIMLPG